MSKTARKPFVDFRDIRSRITMEQVLRHYNLLDTFKRKGNALSGCCPIHKGTNPTQFRVNLEKNLWNCFSEHDAGGNTLDFIAQIENISIHDAALKACEWFNIPIGEDDAAGGGEPKPSGGGRAPAPADESKPKPDGERPQAPPQDNTPNTPLKFKLDKLQREHPYLTQGRGLTLETIVDFGLGYFTGSKGMMVGHVVIPIHNAKGELVAYAGRWPGEPPDKETPKYKLPPGFKKAQELYNLDRAIKEPGPLVLVEGFFDVIKLHQHGCRKVVALMGSSLSAAQEQLIRQHIPASGQVIVMLDENPAGQAGRKDIAGRLAEHCLVRTHVFDQADKEPEHLTADEVRKIIGGVA